MELQSISVNDGKETPVAHVFKPVQRAGNTSNFAELAANGALLGRNALKITNKPLGQGGRTTQEVEIELHIPNVVVETVNGVTRQRVLDTDRIVIRHIAAASSDAARRKDVRVLGSNLLLNAVVAAVIDNAETFTG